LEIEYSVNCIGDWDNSNDSEDDGKADVESGINHPECPKQQDISASPNDPGLIWPTRRSQKQAGKVLVTIDAMETRRNKRIKKM